jgi:hypothetical protein
METPFAITVSSDSIRIQNGSGETTVTVTNTGSQQLKGRAEILPAKPEAKSWLSVARDPERVFKPGVVEQFVVQVKVPAGSAEGDHAFRLRVADVADPNERVTIGPTVGFKIPATAAPAPRPFPMWLLFVIGGLFLAIVGGILYWALSKPAPVAKASEPPVVHNPAPTHPTPTPQPPTPQPQPPAAPAPGEYTIMSRATGKVLDVPAFSNSDGTQIQLYTSNHGTNQRWTLIPKGDGWFLIESHSSGKVLDVPAFASQNSVVIQQYTRNDGTNQQWKFVPTSDGFFKIVSRSSLKLLDVPGGSAADGTKLQQYQDNNGGANQQWRLDSMR